MTTGLWRSDVLAGACVYSLGDAGLPKCDAQSNCSHRLCCHKGKDNIAYFSGRRMKSEEPENKKWWGRSWREVIYQFLQFSSPCTPCEGDKTDFRLADTTSRRETIKVYSFHFMLCFWTTVFFASTFCVSVCVLASLKQCLPTWAGSGHMQHLSALRNNSRCFLGWGISS